LKILNLQQVIRKITFATLQTTNVLIQNAPGLQNNQIMAKQVDTIAMLGHVNTQLAQLRRDEIKPSLKAEYCRFSHDFTKIQTTKLLILLILYFNEV